MSHSLEARVTELEKQVQDLLKILAPVIAKAECDQAITTLKTVLGAK